MDVPLVSSLIVGSPGSLGSIGPITNRARPADVAPGVALLAPSLTTVDLSPLGRFLSAASLFQKKMLELQVSGSTVTESQSQDFSDILATSTSLALAFNELQTNNIGGADVDSDSLEQQSPSTLFAQQLAARTEAGGADPDSALASLASIGLRFNPNAALGANDSMTIDLPLLQAALEADPVTTSALLSRAGAAFSTLIQSDLQVADLLADEPQASSALSPAAFAPPTGAAGVPSRDDVFLQELISENAGAFPARAATPAPRGDVLPDDQQTLVPAGALVPEGNNGKPVPDAGQDARPAAALQAQNAFDRASQAQIGAAADRATTRADVQELVDTSSRAAPPANRELAEQALAERAIALAGNERTQSATENERAALSDAIAARERQNLSNANKTVAAQVQDENRFPALNQAAAGNVNRTLAEQSLADKAVKLATNERNQSTLQDARFGLSQSMEEQDRLKQGNTKAQDRIADQQRQQRAPAAQQLEIGNPLEPTVNTRTTTLTPRLVQQAEESAVVQARTAAPGLRDQALQAARDPAIAAAIAAYSLNTGAFGVLNARQELAAPKVKTIPAVSSVAKVAAVASATEPKPDTP